MKVILSFVTSLDGFVTDEKKRPPHVWASPEDQKHFFALIRSSRLVIMGGKTYQSRKNMLRLSPQVLRVVMTRNPKRHLKDSVPGQLEFTSLSPRALLRSLEKRGYSQVLLAAGPKLAREFVKAKLVDELQLTVEPLLFGTGMPLGLGSVRLELISCKKINAKGTLTLQYRTIF